MGKVYPLLASVSVRRVQGPLGASPTRTETDDTACERREASVADGKAPAFPRLKSPSAREQKQTWILD